MDTKMSVVITVSNPDMTKEEVYEIERVIGSVFMEFCKQLLPGTTVTGKLTYDHGEA